MVSEMNSNQPATSHWRESRTASSPCYNLSSPERVYVEADPVNSSAGGIRNSENQRNSTTLETR
jgi:hypothetical protein